MKPALMYWTLSLLVLFSSSSAWATSFQTATTSSLSPYSPYGAVFGAFSAAGRQDLAITLSDGSSNNVRIMSGDGAGGFPSAREMPADAGPGSILRVDLNSDGMLDLVVSNFIAGTVSIFISKGGGSFQLRSDYTVGSSPTAIIAGDFRGDGIRDDIAVVNSADNSVAILLNNGAGSMTVQGSGSWPASADEISAIAVGDFNGDDIDDIIITRNTVATTSLFRGNGLGTFLAATDVTVGVGPLALVAADFDGDGLDDMAVLNSRTGVNATVSIIRWSREWSFSVANTYAVTDPDDNLAEPSTLISSDLSRDGITDLAVANRAKNSVAVLRGKGDGTFLAAESFATGSAPTGLAAADLDGGGNDLASISTSNSSYSILLNSSAVVPGLSVYPGSYNFGKLQSGGHTLYSSKFLSLSNNGSDSLSISSMTMSGTDSGYFEVTVEDGATCPNITPIIIPGTSCTVLIKFKAYSPGDRSATLTVVSNAANNSSVVVPLSGRVVSLATLYDVNISFLGRGGGTVTFSPEETGCSSDCSRTPPAGTVILTPVADGGAYLYGWSGCDSTELGTCRVTMDSDRNLTVNFGVTPRRIRLDPGGHTYSATAQEAYAAAGTFDTLKLPAGLLDENLDLKRVVEVTLAGGYDSSFTSQGAPTILRSLTISLGSAVVDNITVQ